MHADEAIGAARGPCQPRDRDRGGIGRQDRAVRADRVELAEQVPLRRLVLDDGLDDDVGLGEARKNRRGRDPGEGRGLLLRRALATGDLPVEVLLDRPEGLLEIRPFQIRQENVESRRGRDVGDAAAHLAGADDPQGPDFHGRTLLQLEREAVGGRREPRCGGNVSALRLKSCLLSYGRVERPLKP